MSKQLTFYFIRHGRTQWNEQGLLQGSGNSPLTEQGIAGAQKTGTALQQVEFTAAYSSILQRAIDTAGHIIGQRPIPLFQHCGLNEQSFGSWEGMQIDDLRKLTEFKQLTNDPAAYKALSNGGETFEQLAVRAMAALYDIIKVHQSGANILVVSHGHTLRLLLSLLGGATWENHRDEGKSVSLLNTSISIVKYNSESGFHIEQLNDVAHLQ